MGPVDYLAWEWFKFGQKNISAIWAYVPLLGLQIYRDVMYGVGVLSVLRDSSLFLMFTQHGLMNENRQRLRVLPQQQQESENHLTVHASGNLSIPWRFVCRGSFVVGVVVLVIHLAPNVAAKLNFDGSIEWNSPDSTELQR